MYQKSKHRQCFFNKATILPRQVIISALHVFLSLVAGKECEGTTHLFVEPIIVLNVFNCLQLILISKGSRICLQISAPQVKYLSVAVHSVTL